MADRAATVADVRAVPSGSDLASVSDADVTTAIDYALTYVSSARFGDRYSQAHALAAAHVLVTMGVSGVPASLTTGGGGSVASVSHGPASVSYATTGPSSAEDAWWWGSKYGKLFLAERNRARGRGSAVRTGRTPTQRS